MIVPSIVTLQRLRRYQIDSALSLCRQTGRREGIVSGEHVFDKYSIPAGGFVHQHMGHGSDDTAVLDDGAPAHALHDPAGDFQEAFIRDLDHHIAVSGISAPVDGADVDIEALDLCAAYIRQDFCRA